MELKFIPTRDDYMAATRGFAAKNNVLLWWIVGIIYLPMLCVYLINLLSNRPWDYAMRMPFTLFLLVIPPFIFFKTQSGTNKIAAQVRENPGLTQETSWQMDANEICIHNTFGETKLSWEAFAKAAENQEYYFILYAANKNCFQFIPKRIFDGQSTTEKAFRDLLQSKLGDIDLIKAGAGNKIFLYILGVLYCATIVAVFYSNFH